MSQICTFAAIFLFWATLSVSLMHVQLVASPVYKMRVPTHRSVSIRSTATAQVKVAIAATSYN